MQPEALVRLKAVLADRYVIERELGRGGMAVVFLAQDIKHGRPVAIKVLRPELAAALGTERFLREIETSARLNHPHIVPLYDSGDAEGLLYYVMPYIEGETLRDRLARDGRLSLSEALHIVREVGSALSYAHSKDVVHRDIKPANILLAGGHAVVADFGIARAISASGGPGLTQAGIAVGTPQYMSPEQVVGSENLDGRSDIYSLACVLYEMLSGAPPFEGQTAQAIIAKRFKDPAPRLGALNNSVPVDIRQAMLRAFATEPVERYDSATGFVQAMGLPRGTGATLVERVGVMGVAGLFLLASLVLLAVVRFLMEQLGLPDWVMPGAGALLMVGLPIMVGAAYSEQRMAAGKGPLLPFLTWANAMRGGVLSLGGWAGVVVVYMAMRALGIGPVGTLVAAGVLEEQGRIIVADFENRTADSLLGQAVTEAFRVDLAQSPMVTLMDPATVARALERMQRSPEERLTEELAREVAVREGIGAVVAGDVTAVGGRYVLAARVFAPGDGALLAAFRETANDSTEIIEAVDRLSEELRKKVGESLKTIRGSEPLAEVTTASLDALVKYSGAIVALNQGEVTRAIGLLEEAVELDTAFAMAYRKLGVTALNRAERVAALTKAYEHRERLTARERNQTLGTYYTVVRDDEEGAIAAYRAVLETYPYDYVALNNLALIYMDRREYAQAETLLRRAVEADSFVSAAYINGAIAQVAQGEFDRAQATLTQYAEKLPEHPRVRWIAAGFESARGNHDAAEDQVRRMLDEQRGDPLWSTNASFGRATLALVRGRLDEAEQHIRAALATGAELDLPGMELGARIQLAFVDLWYRGDKAGALRQVDAALERLPLEELDPLNRPYNSLAMFFALAEEPERARAMLDEYEGAVEPGLRMNYEEGRHSIQGMLDLARGRAEEAVEEFRAADVGVCSICALPLIGMAYDQGGNADSALAVYERYVTTPWLGRDESDWWGLGFIYERLGQLHAERGDVEQATEYYGRFVELWDEADPELQPRVEQARREITRLAGEPRASG